MKTCVAILVVILVVVHCHAQEDKEQFQVNSSVKRLKLAGNAPDLEKDPLIASGKLTKTSALDLLGKLHIDTANKVAIIHVLRWDDADHKNVKFQKWYVLDSASDKAGFYLASPQQRFEGDLISGHQDFVLAYVHINFKLGDSDESVKTDLSTGETSLVHPINYQIQIAKQKTQLQKDFETVLQIVGITKAAATETEIGYFSGFPFHSEFSTSQLTISAGLKENKPTEGSTGAQANKTDANAIASKTYQNQKPSYVGLSFAVPLTSYKDIQFQNSGLQPKTIDRQNLYLTLDGYFPAAQPGLTSFRYIPHPFFGVPIKSQPLRHTMVGLGIGLRWLEPFGGVVFDMQKLPAGGAGQTNNRLVLKGVWGLKVSVDTVKNSLKK